MKIPASIILGTHKIKITEHDTLIRPSDGVDMCGHSSLTFGTIDLAKTCKSSITEQFETIPEASRTDTFLHEIVHLISFHFGLALTEEQVSGVSSGLLDVIRLNKLNFMDTK